MAAGREESLHAEVQRLQGELERYQAHAQRTSKLFLSATRYAEWVRESARRDAELALAKARARVERLEHAARELEQTERELARARSELDQLQKLADETRARLSAFLTSGLELLNPDPENGQGEESPPTAGGLQEALEQRVRTTSPALGDPAP